MLRGIFEPFGKIDNIQLIMDPETGRSKGYGFLTVSLCMYLGYVLLGVEGGSYKKNHLKTSHLPNQHLTFSKLLA